METVLHIKNMVCNRCIMVVRDLLEKQGLEPRDVRLGMVTIAGRLEPQVKESLGAQLSALGFELLDSKRARLVEEVKNAIIELVHYNDGGIKVNLSDYIAAKVNHDYNYVSGLFSETENITIEKYFIAQKIERVKELLAYDEMSLGEIAVLLNYSSAAHLSAQFKKVTGLTPSRFRQIGERRRKPLDEV